MQKIDRARDYDALLIETRGHPNKFDKLPLANGA
jgi:hypothetical protein